MIFFRGIRASILLFDIMNYSVTFNKKIIGDKMVKKSRLKNFPISFFSIMLGLLGFTIANQKAVEILHLPYDISSILILFSAGSAKGS